MNNDPTTELESTSDDNSSDLFPHTRWTLIADVRGSDDGLRLKALGQLCDIYWYPIYAYARKRGYSSYDAEDFTQELFYRMVKHDGFAGVREDRGRLRSYLLTSVSRLFNEEWRKQSALKRGGGGLVLSIDAELAEKRYRNEPRCDETPETLFNKRWALALLKEVESRLGKEYATRGKSDVFDALKSHLMGKPSGAASYSEIAKSLDLTVGNVKVQMHRMRERFGEVVREEISETVSNKSDIEDELRHLRAALS